MMGGFRRPGPARIRAFSRDCAGLSGGAPIETPAAVKARKTHLPPGLANNARSDAWWTAPVLTALVLAGFVAYASWRVLENQFYIADNGVYHYATPFGNPDFTPFVPGFLFSIPLVGHFFGYPGVLILPFVAGFRFTCYYYRKAYYRGFAATPPACAVKGTGGLNYKGERGLLVIQNFHRFFLYAALVVLLFNLYDALHSIFTPHGLYFGLGSAIMLLNVVLLGAYTLGCHSLRHIVGGRLDCFSCDFPSRMKYSLWQRVTLLNQRHMLWAWMSLVWVAFTDFYIRYLASTGMTTVLGAPA